LRGVEKILPGNLRVDVLQVDVQMPNKGPQDVHKGKPAHQKLEPNQDPGKVGSFEADPEEEGHVDVGVGAGPDIDQEHDEAFTQHGAIQERGQYQ